MQTIGERIKYLRNKRKLSMAELEKAIDAATGSVNNWEKDRRVPGGNNIIALSRFFNVSTDWLLTGKESGFTDTEIKILQVFNDFNQYEQEELENYIQFLLWRRKRGINEKGKRYFRAYGSSYGEKFTHSFALEKNEEDREDEEEDKVFLPLIGQAAAGNPIYIEELLEGYVPVEKRFSHSGKAFLVRAKGDSMITAGIEDGDLVLVRMQPAVENGEIALVRVDNEAAIKYFHRDGSRIILKPANSKYRPMVIAEPAKVTVIGKVMEILKKEDAEPQIRHFF